MKRILFFLLFVVTSQFVNAQSVGIGTTTPSASAQLDVTSTTKGMLIPRMTGAQRTAIPSPESGLLVIQTNTEIIPPSSPGFYIFEQSGIAPGAWKRIARADEITGGTSTWTVNGSNQYSNVAGNVGIGTSSPSASALLDLTSTSKGILVPRMTTAQRTAIVSPASGLFVYDITSNGFWYYDGSAWVQISNAGGSDWLNNANDIYNGNTGNVGIGTSTPTSKFHLIGNLLQESGNLTINNTIPTLQFQNSGVNKGFLQTTGGDNNILIGTSSGNTAGRFIVRLNGISSLVVEPNGNAGIGTATPNASAKLDIASTTGGLLIPRMTIVQKISIASPATGLIVYDTDLKEFSYYDGADWLRILNGNYDYWNKSLSRHWVYNITDSIGLGISSPTEKLDVFGNIRSRDNITANGYITATGTVQGGALATGGNLLVVGEGNVVGNLQINSDLIINNTAAILQLKSSNVDKGFVQLSSDDLRIGTNSSNTTGRFIIRTGGNDVMNVRNSGLVSVGINVFGAGAINPNAIFQVTNSNDKVQIDNTGKVGIGFISSETILSRLHIRNGSDASLTSHGYLMLGDVTGTNLIFDDNEIMARSDGGTASLVLQNNGGSVRIGNVAVPSGYKFAINGKMICEELKVKLASSGWPDYVFDKKYKLPALGEVEKFIQEHQHLPNMPSAADVEKNGIEVGDMQRRMMEKIEELTLYIFDLKKEIDSLKGKK